MNLKVLIGMLAAAAGGTTAATGSLPSSANVALIIGGFVLLVVDHVLTAVKKSKWFRGAATDLSAADKAGMAVLNKLMGQIPAGAISVNPPNIASNTTTPLNPTKPKESA